MSVISEALVMHWAERKDDVAAEIDLHLPKNDTERRNQHSHPTADTHYSALVNTLEELPRGRFETARRAVAELVPYLSHTAIRQELLVSHLYTAAERLSIPVIEPASPGQSIDEQASVM
jgi:hypothetical protein